MNGRWSKGTHYTTSQPQLIEDITIYKKNTVDDDYDWRVVSSQLLSDFMCKEAES